MTHDPESEAGVLRDSALLTAGRTGLIGYGARKLAEFLAAQAWTPEQLSAEIDRGSDWVLRALGSMAPGQARWARFAFGRVVASMRPEDWWELCKHDALHGQFHEHMWLATRAERWPRTLACFRQAQLWFMHGSPPTPGAPPG